MNALFLTDRIEGSLIPHVRIRRLPLGNKSPNVRRYRALLALTPALQVWKETPGTEDGWSWLEDHGLSKDDLFSLWDNLEADVQLLSEQGEWGDVFAIEYPNKPPVAID